MKIIYKGKRYLVTGEAYSMNDGKYYVAYGLDTDNEKARLVPADQVEETE